MILDPSGGAAVVQAAAARTPRRPTCSVQEYAGKPVLTWWQGDISVHGFGLGEDVIADEHLHGNRARAGRQRPCRPTCTSSCSRRRAPRWSPPTTRSSATCPRVGGSSDGAVTDGVFQEIDVRTGLVMYEWTSLDHVALSESYALAEQLERAVPLRLLPHQLDQPRPRRQPADLGAQHLGGLRRSTPPRGQIALAARRQALELHRAPAHAHRLAARSARTARRLDQHLRQRLLARRSTRSRAGSS